MVDKRTSTLCVIPKKNFTLMKTFKEILETIQSEKAYKEKDILITNFESTKALSNTQSTIVIKDEVKSTDSSKNSSYLFMRTEKENSLYLGGVNEKLEREGYGISKHSNQDLYIGHYAKDCRQGKGLYIISTLNNDSDNTFLKNANYEFYNGYFNGDRKHGLGSYIWIDELKNNSSIENANLSAFIGTFDNDKCLKGLYLEKNFDAYSAYYGNFRDGLMHDSKALVYDNQSDRVFRARYEDGVVNQGYLVTFKDDEHTELTFVMFENGKPKATISERFIERETGKKINDECREFRRLLFEDDCFGVCYSNAKKLLDESSGFLKMSREELNCDEGYNKVLSLLNNTNEQTVFKSIFKQIG